MRNLIFILNLKLLILFLTVESSTLLPVRKLSWEVLRVHFQCENYVSMKMLYMYAFAFTLQDNAKSSNSHS